MHGRRQKLLERAAPATRRVAHAMLFSRFNKQGMKFIIDARVGLEAPVDEILGFRVPGVVSQQAMSRQDSPGVGVSDEHRPVPRVQQDGIGGFWAETSHLQQRAAQLLSGLLKHSPQGTLVMFFKPADEGDNRTSLLPEEAGGSDEGLKLALFGPAQVSQIDQSGFAKLPDRQGRVPPVRVLGQDRPEDDLQATFCGPPTLWSVLREEPLVIAVQLARLGLSQPRRDCITRLATAGYAAFP